MLVLSACWLMTACGAKSPSDIAKIVVKAEQTLNYEPMKKYLTEKCRSQIEKLEEFIKRSMEDDKLKETALSNAKETSYEIISEEISEDGNSATVTVLQSQKNFTSEMKIHFVKVNGEWKVSKFKL
jgi:hypothetical protein